jgi:hypothetical protein
MVNLLKKHKLRSLIRFLLAAAALLVACTPLQTGSPTTVPTTDLSAGPMESPATVLTPDLSAEPTVAISPTAVDTDSEVTQVNVCHVLIAEYEEQLGGMPALLEAIYIAEDGTVQQTRERSDDTILGLREGRVDTSNVFQSLHDIELPLPPDEYAEPDEHGVVLPEYAGPTLLVEVAFCDASSRQWIGSPDAAPYLLQQLVLNAKALVQTLPSQSVVPERKYIRSQLRRPYEIEHIPSVVRVTREQLASDPLLREAITHERRLVRVPSDEALYCGISLSFSHGESVNIEYDQQVFQIRHLVTGEE